MVKEKLVRKGTVVVVLKNTKTGKEKKIVCKNIITNDGDKYYAQEGAGESPHFAVVGCRLGTGTTAPTKSDTDVETFFSGGSKATKATYPKTNDGDSDNTGAGVDVVTWCFEFATGEGNQADIAEIAVVDSLSSPTKALSHALFSPTFTKTSADTLKVFVNHENLGV